MKRRLLCHSVAKREADQMADTPGSAEGRELVIVISRHQHDIAAAMSRDLHWLLLGSLLVLAELSLKLGCINSQRHVSIELQSLTAVRTAHTPAN